MFTTDRSCSSLGGGRNIWHLDMSLMSNTTVAGTGLQWQHLVAPGPGPGAWQQRARNIRQFDVTSPGP